MNELAYCEVKNLTNLLRLLEKDKSEKGINIYCETAKLLGVKLSKAIANELRVS